MGLAWGVIHYWVKRTESGRKIGDQQYRKLTKEHVDDIIFLRKSGWTYSRIQEKYPVDRSSLIHWVKKMNGGKAIKVAPGDSIRADGMVKQIELKRLNREQKKEMIEVNKEISGGPVGAGGARVRKSLKGRMYKDYIRDEESRLKSKNCPHNAVSPNSKTCFRCGYVVQ